MNGRNPIAIRTNRLFSPFFPPLFPTPSESALLSRLCLSRFCCRIFTYSLTLSQLSLPFPSPLSPFPSRRIQSFGRPNPQLSRHPMTILLPRFDRRHAPPIFRRGRRHRPAKDPFLYFPPLPSPPHPHPHQHDRQQVYCFVCSKGCSASSSNAPDCRSKFEVAHTLSTTTTSRQQSIQSLEFGVRTWYMRLDGRRWNGL